MKKAIYPGSFDPITFGHIDIIKRASRMFDELTVCILDNKAKSSLFSVDERVKMINDVIKDLGNVKVDYYNGLLIDYAKERDVHISIRGLRAITDFEYELQIAQVNKQLSSGELDTVFLTTSIEYSYLSSSAVKEIASFKGDISGLVPPKVKELVESKYNK